MSNDQPITVHTPGHVLDEIERELAQLDQELTDLLTAASAAPNKPGGRVLRVGEILARVGELAKGHAAAQSEQSSLDRYTEFCIAHAHKKALVIEANKLHQRVRSWYKRTTDQLTVFTNSDGSEMLSRMERGAAPEVRARMDKIKARVFAEYGNPDQDTTGGSESASA